MQALAWDPNESPLGAIVSGVVASLDGDYAEIEFGDHRGRVPLSDFPKEDAVAAGARFDFFVDDESPRTGFLLSRERAVRMAAFDALAKDMAESTVLDGQVVEAIDGGFVVDVGLRAFVPASQFALRPAKNPEQFVGQWFRFRVLRVEADKGNLVLTRRAVLEEARDEVLGRLQPGALVDGTVTRLAPFGAFVDVGGFEALLHLDDMSWGRIKHPKDAVAVGQTVTVKVLSVDRKKHRVGVGLRQASESPWIDADQRYRPGVRVRGEVISKTDYGAFIELEPGIEALVVQSAKIVGEDLAQAVADAPVGAVLAAEVLDVSVAERRISLRLVPDSAKNSA